MILLKIVTTLEDFRYIEKFMLLCYNKKKARCYPYENTRCKARMISPDFLHEKALLPLL